LKNNFFN